MQQTESISLTALSERLRALEAENAIRRLMARYMAICDDLTPETPLQDIADLFTPDAIWEGSGERYRDTFGGHRGRDAIVAFLGTYCDPPHFASNTHFLTTEDIQVEGEKAVGSWVMLQTPSFQNGESFVLAARLSIQFEFDGQEWRIARFKTTNLFGRPVDGGWHSDASIPKPTN